MNRRDRARHLERARRRATYARAGAAGYGELVLVARYADGVIVDVEIVNDPPELIGMSAELAAEVVEADPRWFRLDDRGAYVFCGQVAYLPTGETEAGGSVLICERVPLLPESQA